MKNEAADQLTRYLNALIDLFDAPPSPSDDSTSETTEESAQAALKAALSKRDCRVIMVVGEARSIKMRDLANHAKLSVSNTTGVIERLVQQGFVTRERSYDDRRVVNIVLTTQGQAVYRQEQSNFRQVSMAILDALEPHEQVMMLAMMRKVAMRVKAHAMPGHST
ncbi:MarR family winged helix-turn-helix transcriptional regulator [Ephemeroptericola cinctiostellae]|nr:MarR family transcriptional regulator [Ephemeroptericola cinctiostellae]